MESSQRKGTNKIVKKVFLNNNGDLISPKDIPWNLSRKGPGLFFEFATDGNVHEAMDSVHLPQSLVNLKTWYDLY
jgi:hypothetical protein